MDNAIEDEWTREAIRLHRRYQTEVVQGFGLCPWAERAVRDGRVRARVVLHSDGDVAPSLAAMQGWADDPTADVAFVIYPNLRLDRHEFHDFAARVRDADTSRYELGRAPFVYAAFHPDASADTTDAERLIPYLRRTPDPTLQLLRGSVLDGIRSGGAQGTQFISAASLEAALAGTGQPPLRERIARANLETAERVGLDAVERCFDAIRRDRDETYAVLRRLGRRG